MFEKMIGVRLIGAWCLTVIVSNATFAQSNTGAFDANRLQNSLKQASWARLGIPEAESMVGALQDFLPELVVQDDAQAASLVISVPSKGEFLVDGKETLDLEVRFTAFDEANYHFEVSGFPSRLEFPEGVVQLGGINLSGRWNVEVHAVGALDLKMGAIQSEGFSEVSVFFEGLELFFGQLKDYEGDVNLETAGINEKTAEILAFTAGNLELKFQDESSSFNLDGVPSFSFAVSGAEFSSLIGVEATSDQRVPNIQYGTSEAIDFNMKLNKLFNFQMDNRLEDLLAMGESFGDDLEKMINAYKGVQSYSKGFLGEVSIKSEEDADDSFEAYISGASFLTETAFDVQSHSGFSVDILPLKIRFSEGGLAVNEIFVDFSIDDIDFNRLGKRLSALFRSNGSFGDLSALFLESFDRVSIDYGFGGIEFFGGSEQISPLIQLEDLSYGMEIGDVQNVKGGHIAVSKSIDGLAIHGSAQWDGIANEFLLDPAESELGDMIPNESEMDFKLTGIPFHAWQKLLDTTPRRASMLDMGAYREEAKILPIIGMQLLAPLIERPPMLNAQFRLSSPMFEIEGFGDYHLNPLIFPGKGEGQVTFSNGDRLWEALSAVSKRMDNKLNADGEKYSFADIEFVEGLKSVAAFIKALRDIAEIGENGAYLYNVLSVPETGVTVNAIEFDALVGMLQQ